MSQCVNKIILVGFLGATPELKFTVENKPVCSFNLAVNERWKDSEGVPQDAVQWFRIVSFGRLAEVCAEFLAKERHAFVEGRLQCRNWEDRNGDKRTTVEVIAQEVRILDSGSRNGKGKPTAPETQNDLEDVPF
jgi:single-strand DNA-binding protein